MGYGVKRVFRSRKGDKGAQYHLPPLRGSRLFHDPENPRLDMFPDPDAKGVNRSQIGRYGDDNAKHRPFPLVLLRAAHQVSQGLYYNPLDYSLTRRMKEGDPQKIYSQAREALAKLSATMIMHYNIGYGMIGKVDSKGRFCHMTLLELASRAGLNYERAKRAMQIMRDKGAVKVSKQYEKNDDGSFSGYASIKTLTHGFWAMFGFGEWIKEERKKRYKKRMKAEAAGEDSSPAPVLKREKVMADMCANASREQAVAIAKAALNA